MRPKSQNEPQLRLFEKRLEELIDLGHELVKLSKRISWDKFDERFGAMYCPVNGRPGLATRLMVGLTYLKYLYNVSDEAVLRCWVENPYWQYFCGEEYFQHKAPCDRTMMSRFRGRIGTEGAEALLQESLSVAKDAGLLKVEHLRELYVDTTVQEKNITYPTDAKLLYRAKVRLVSLAKRHDVTLRQSYRRVARRHLIMSHRYSAAKHYNRARREVRKLRTILGRVVRDITRKLPEEKKSFFTDLLSLAQRVLESAKGGEKIYSLHEPHTEAIAKGKIHKRFEFGVKVSLVTTRKRGFVLGAKAIHGNPYDGHTLNDALKDAQDRIGGEIAAKVGVDLGYRGHHVEGKFRVLHPRLKRVTKREKLFVRARSAIEARISLLKRCYRLGRNYLAGKVGDCMNALLAGAACNLGLVLCAT